MTGFVQWSPRDAAALIAVPRADDDKYSRGVLGVVTGSPRYPGAAVLGVEGAMRTGVGMVRYLGPAAELVLQRRPEVVTVPGRVQAWLLGSGIEPSDREPATTESLHSALAEGVPVAIDSGALDLVSLATSPAVVTPHSRELGRMLGVDSAQISDDPERWAVLAADRFGVTVLLKGSRTLVAAPDGTRLVTGPASPWLATAGTGDVLGGILGSLLATHADGIADDPPLVARLAATAAVVHAEAARAAGGPLAALDVAEAVPRAVAELLRAGSGADRG